MQITVEERQVLRDLARRVRDIASLDIQAQKRQAIIDLNGLRSRRPIVYCFPEGAWLECIPPTSLQCKDPVLRGWETRLRMAVYTHESIGDDQVIDPVFNVYYQGGFSGWGLAGRADVPDADKRQPYYLNPYTSLSLKSHSHLAAYHVDPPMKERSDLARLRVPQLTIDRETSDQWLSVAQDILGDILTVRRRGCFWTIIGGLPVTAVGLRGMENLWLDMIDDPAWVHEFVQFLAHAHQSQLDALEQGGYLTLNNEAEWIGTGGIGYTDELPGTVCDPTHVRLRNIWGGLQAQDLVGISPAMFAEFFFPHMKPIMERFGLSHFGCCEPVDGWLPALMGVRNLRRISISAWANVRQCAAQIRGNYVFSYKPLPSLVATPTFREKVIERTYRESFQIAREHGCHVEVMMKDLHTIQREPGRLRRWVEIARRAVDQP